MQIIEKGNTTYWCRCMGCQTIIGFEDWDVKNMHGHKVITCPSCRRIMFMDDTNKNACERYNRPNPPAM